MKQENELLHALTDPEVRVELGMGRRAQVVAVPRGDQRGQKSPEAQKFPLKLMETLMAQGLATRYFDDHHYIIYRGAGSGEEPTSVPLEESAEVAPPRQDTAVVDLRDVPAVGSSEESAPLLVGITAGAAAEMAARPATITLAELVSGYIPAELAQVEEVTDTTGLTIVNGAVAREEASQYVTRALDSLLTADLIDPLQYSDASMAALELEE